MSIRDNLQWNQFESVMDTNVHIKKGEKPSLKQFALKNVHTVYKKIVLLKTKMSCCVTAKIKVTTEFPENINLCNLTRNKKNT